MRIWEEVPWPQINRVFLGYFWVTLILRIRCSIFYRYDGDSSENSTDNSVDKSKPWSRSIEDLHGGNSLSSAVTGNSISRSSRHSTLRCEHASTQTSSVVGTANESYKTMILSYISKLIRCVQLCYGVYGLHVISERLFCIVMRTVRL